MMDFTQLSGLTIPEGNVVKIELDGVVLWCKHEDATLPEGYTELDYIEVTGTQYIDTGFIPNQDTRIVCEFKYLGGTGVYGARNAVSNNNFSMRVINGAWQLGYGDGVKTGTILADNEWHTADQDKNALYIDSVLAATREIEEFTSSYPVAIGAIHASSMYYGQGCYRSFKIYNNGTLVRDFVPCTNDVGENGMYDYVTKAFYGNSGTGTILPLCYRYVTLGDSVGAGYGVENDEDDFTGLLHTQLESIYGSSNVSTQNKAIGGHKIPDLMSRLDEADVYDAVRKANLVTISIGGNDMLFPAFEHLEDYIFSGDSALAQMTADCTNTLKNTLANDDYPTSYNNLFKKLVSINPNAKICFTTQYNPYKYLWAEEGENGFFKPLFDTLPDNLGLAGDLLRAFIRESFFNMELVKNFFNRINGLGAWVENLVSELNKTLKLKMGEFNNENFFVAETKALYDSIPDRQGSGEVHYNDLVHVKYTRGYNFGDIHWGKLWDNTRITDKDGNVLSNTVCNSAYDFWSTLVSVYWNGSSIDTNGLVETLLYMVAEHIVMPDVDLHPKEDGYYLLMRSFADTLRNNVAELAALPSLNTITYNANGGTGSMATQKVLDISRGKMVYSITKPNSFSPATGYYHIGWTDGSGNSYSNEQAIHVAGDTNLYAQWSNLYTVTFRHSKQSTYHSDSDTGPQECYALWIEGAEQADLGAFSNPARTYTLPYGTALGVIAQTASGSARSYVTVNGNKVAETSSDARWGFTLTGNTDIHFEWNYFLAESLPPQQSYWNCYITTR